MSSFRVTSFPAISGGLPTKPDEAPSIIFVIAYVALLPPAIWRTYNYRRPFGLLFTFVRLCLFIGARIATFILRAIEATTVTLPNNPVPSVPVFTGEQVLLGVGFIVLVDLLIEMVKSHIWRTDVPVQDETQFSQQGQANRLQQIVRGMHLLLLVAIGLGGAAGGSYNSALTNPSAALTVDKERTASTAISLTVTALCTLVSLFLLVRFPHLGAQRTLYLLFTSCILLVVPAYRISTISAQTTEADLVSVATRAKFFILQATTEWLVAGLMVFVDVRVWFFAGGEQAQMMLSGAKHGPTRAAGTGEEQYPMDAPRHQQQQQQYPMDASHQGKQHRIDGQGSNQPSNMYGANHA